LCKLRIASFIFCFIVQGGVQILQVGPESCQNEHGFHHFNPLT